MLIREGFFPVWAACGKGFAARYKKNEIIFAEEVDKRLGRAYIRNCNVRRGAVTSRKDDGALSESALWKDMKAGQILTAEMLRKSPPDFPDDSPRSGVASVFAHRRTRRRGLARRADGPARAPGYLALRRKRSLPTSSSTRWAQACPVPEFHRHRHARDVGRARSIKCKPSLCHAPHRVRPMSLPA